MSKQHGMLFADRLMPPLLDGTKTQTRRPVKFKNPACNPLPIVEYARDGMPIWWQYPPTEEVRQSDYYDHGMPCPFGRVGDQIWARETFWLGTRIGSKMPVMAVYADADGRMGDQDVMHPDAPDASRGWALQWKKTPSIHMPKWACRCWLEITDVRVQRIQEISEEDAKAEGILDGGCINCGQSSLAKPQCCDTPAPSFRDSFCYEWKQIYPDSWERNDWVWALTFKRVEAPK